MTMSTPPEGHDPLPRRHRDTAVSGGSNAADVTIPSRSGAGTVVILVLAALLGVGAYRGLNALENESVRGGLERVVNAVIGILLAIGLPVVVGVRRARRWWPRFALLAVLLLLTAPLATCSFLLFVGGQWGR